MGIWLLNSVKILVAVALLYLLYCAGLFLAQRQLLFPGTRIPRLARLAPGPGVEQVWLDADGGRVEAWLLPADRDNRLPGPALIFAHGNNELIDFWAGRLGELSRRGLTLLLVEYPGYGRSQGVPSEESIGRAFVMAYDFLVDRPEVDSRRIVFWGRSLGGGAVCALLAERPAAALVLMSTFTSVRAMAGRFLIPPFLVRDSFDNLEVVKGYQGPVLIVHGQSDRIVPYTHARRLARAAQGSRMLTYASGHNDCPPDWEHFFGELEAFLLETGVMEHGPPD